MTGGESSVGGGCTARVAALCDTALTELPPGRHRDQVVAVRAQFAAPLRVAIAGRVKAGKSTLVNAMVGQRVAPTAVEECTKVVTWFSYGVSERIEVVLRDGTTVAVAFEDGRIPDPLGPELSTIESVRVFLSREVLKDMTLIDTPGLSSVRAEHSARTEALLVDRASRTATRQADALIFLLGHGVREDEAEALAAFDSLFEDAQVSPATSVAVLSRADQVGGGEGDPLQTAARMARRQAEALRSVTATVVPVIGLLAEAAETRSLQERDLVSLEALASLGQPARQQMLFSHEEFQAYESDVVPEERLRLLSVLDLFGIARCLSLLDSGVRDVRGLERELSRLSGVNEVRALLEATFAQRSDALKANAALVALNRISWQAADQRSAASLRELRNAVQEIRLEPGMRRIGEVWAAQEAAAPETLLPDPRRDELVRLTTHDTPAAQLGLRANASLDEVIRAALDSAREWRLYENLYAPTEREARIARVVRRSFEALAAPDS